MSKSFADFYPYSLAFGDLEKTEIMGVSGRIKSNFESITI